MMPGRPPYGYGPPPHPPPPPPQRPGYRPYDGMYGFGEPMVPQATDHRAALSLALGILSLTCGGLFLGVPAIFFGVSARKHIQASGGLTTGTGLATGGIVTGILGTLASFVIAGAFAVSMLLNPGGGGHVSFGGPPRSSTATPHGTAAPAPHRATIGAVDVVNLSSDDGPLKDQLAAELARARASKRTLVVQTTAPWANVCAEIDDALPDARMQAALADVQLVRVDIDEFRGELKSQRMYEGSVPWFYKIDSTVHPTDAISGDEWDENTPENMAPVLKAFASGTLKLRRHTTPLGTPL